MLRHWSQFVPNMSFEDMKLYTTIIRRNTRRRKSKELTISLGKKEEKGLVVVNQTNIEAAVIVKARKILGDEVERLWVFPST